MKWRQFVQIYRMLTSIELDFLFDEARWRGVSLWTLMKEWPELLPERLRRKAC